MTVSELIEHLKKFDGSLPVYAANFHEEYGKVTRETVQLYGDFFNDVTNKEIAAISIVGSL